MTRREQSGVASGLVNTSYQIGSALGLAVIVAVASSQTDTLEKIGLPSLEALNGSFHTAFILGAIISVTATVFSVINKYVMNKYRQPHITDVGKG